MAQNSDYDTTAWPDQIDYPPNATYQPPLSEHPFFAKPAQKEKKEKAESGKDSGKKWYWPFGGEPKEMPVPDKPVVPPKEAKHDIPASPFPLLRLPVPIHTQQGVVASGIYLAQPAKPTESANASEAKMEAGNSNNTARQYVLTRKNQVILAIPLRLAPVDENIALTGTPSPLSKNLKTAPRIVYTAESRVTPDQKGVVFVMIENDQRFESDPFPVATDLRHTLKF